MSNLNIRIDNNDNVYLGLNFNFHSLEFEEYKFFKESGYSSNSNVKRVQFEENLFSYGQGLSIQLGSLLKFNNFNQFFLTIKFMGLIYFYIKNKNISLNLDSNQRPKDSCWLTEVNFKPFTVLRSAN